MEDEEIDLCNKCTDLVGSKKTEAFPLYLFQHLRAGEWVGVQDLCQRIGVSEVDLKPDLFAAWLPDPMAEEAFAVILFYDDETKWSLTAHYNRARLLADGAKLNSKNGASHTQTERRSFHLEHCLLCSQQSTSVDEF